MSEAIERADLSESILRTLLYYDIFSYPLTAAEVFQFVQESDILFENVESTLTSMVDQTLIFKHGIFFSVQDNPSLANRRILGNSKALKAMPRAKRRARLLAGFPFVRAVMISGSMSKGYMDNKSDLDFFVITAPQRLWISRMMIVVFKRVFLLNNNKYFCVNYLIDSEHLEIGEKNLFTATELATLIPMVNPALYHDLLEKNEWLGSFLPNFMRRPVAEVPHLRNSFLKRMLESSINFVIGERLERIFKEITQRRWQRKFAKAYSRKDFDVAFKSTDHVSKNHATNYQRRIMDLYDEKVRAFGALNAMAR